MTSSTVIPLTSIAATILVAIFGLLLKRALHLQDQAQAERDKVERERHDAIRSLLKEQRESLETEIRATRSDVRLVVGDVAEHGRLIAGAAATIDAVNGRLRDAESEVRKLVREGCAHRKSCSDG